MTVCILYFVPLVLLVMVVIVGGIGLFQFQFILETILNNFRCIQIFILKKNNSKTNRRQYEINLNSIQNIGEKKWESVGACVCV